jgi:hypothetical protein
MLQNELLSQISSGAIDSGDKDALSAALNSIDATLRSSAPTAGTRPSPDQMQAKIESLIDDQVESGKLTGEQAEELKNVFSSALPQGGPGGPGGPKGPPPSGGMKGIGGEEEDEESTDVADLLTEFLKNLQEANGTQGYGEKGDKLLSEISSLLFDYKA